MLSAYGIFHIAWFARVTLSLALFLVIISRKIYKQFFFFAIYTGWFCLAGLTVLIMNYSPFISGKQYLVAVSISDGIETVLAFTLIYWMFMERVGQYPAISKLGKSAFQTITLILLLVAVFFAWLIPGLGTGYLTSLFSVIQRTLRILQCGQLIFLFLFFGYFRLSWRSLAFGIALGLGIMSSTNLAVSAIRSQMAVSRVWTPAQYALSAASEIFTILALSVWLSYARATAEALETTRRPPTLPPHELDSWNRELGQWLE